MTMRDAASAQAAYTSTDIFKIVAAAVAYFSERMATAFVYTDGGKRGGGGGGRHHMEKK